MDTAVIGEQSGRTDGQGAQRLSPLHTDYRPYIDGLRAVAVLSVVGFHAFPTQIGGGFVGVDIFFVISGFLISGIIYNALRKNKFSYLEFYVRRVRRIFPALLAVLFACLIGGWFLLLPDEYKQLGKQIAAAASFASNILLWTQAGYFDTDAAIKPLLHLWSLGVEEQFYLLWPLLLAFLYKRTRHLPLVIGCLLLVSFIANVAFVHTYPSATFYLPLTRFWELLCGALLAYLTIFRRDDNARPPLSGKLSVEVLSLVGLAMIVTSLLLVKSNNVFPGWWALLPTLGTLLIITTGDAWLNRVVLSNRIVVFVGLISYPLYLWHWVLLAILRMRLYEEGAEAPRSERVAAVLLSFLLAWLTYALIEKPIRFGSFTRANPVVLTLLMALIGVLGLSVDWSNGAAWRYPPAIRPLAAFEYDKERARFSSRDAGRKCFIDDYVKLSFSDIRAHCIDPPDPNRKLLVLWGDSHAASLYFGLKALQDRRGNFRIGQFTMAACPPVPNREFDDRAPCKPFNDAVLNEISQLKPDIVVLEGEWWYYFVRSAARNRLDGSDLQATISKLKAIGVARIVVFGALPVWRIAQPDVSLKLWLETRALPERTEAYLNNESLRIDSVVASTISGTGVVFVSPIDALCDVRGCLLTTDSAQWQPVAWDAAHLTTAGSAYLIGRESNRILGD